jgi:hypothetical protein
VTGRGRRAKTQTFVEIVEDVTAVPPTPSPQPPRLIAPDGRAFSEASAALDPKQAVELVAGGALAAWDSCGSRGFAAPIEWFDPSCSPEFIRSGPPELRNQPGRRYRGQGELSEWRTDEGAVLVLASLDVKWGLLMG